MEDQDIKFFSTLLTNINEQTIYKEPDWNIRPKSTKLFNNNHNHD